MRKGLTGPPKERRKAPHEVQTNNGIQLTKHGVIIHCNHFLGTGRNIATCERKKAGLPPIRKTKERATPCVDPAWAQVTQEPIITQDVHAKEEPTSQQILSQLTNPMVSQLQQEVAIICISFFSVPPFSTDFCSFIRLHNAVGQKVYLFLCLRVHTSYLMYHQ
jgi:hypothetical protein